MVDEEPALGRGVALHRAVEVEVVLRQVREHRDPEPARPHTLELERVRADLHDQVRAAGVERPVRERLQVVGLGRRVRQRQPLGADARPERPDDGRPAAGALEGRLGHG